MVRRTCFWAGCAAVALLLAAMAGLRASPGRDERKAEFRRPPPLSIPFPENNPFSAEKAALGKMLFFEPLLSRSASRSCASCHNPGLSWGDGLARGVGDSGTPMLLRSPTLLDVAWLPMLGWDGKFRQIETVTFAAITGSANMALDEASAIQRLSTIKGYRRAFEEVFGTGPITRRKVEQAVATYERTLVSQPSPFDQWVDGDEGAIDDAAKRGFDLFTGRAGCSGCHTGWMFTDGSFHDVGTAWDEDIGRGRIFPSSVQLRYAFKVPTLRDIARRAPYMHNGSVPTLEAVVDLYDKGGIDRPSRSPLIRPLGLSAREKANLVAFLQTLTSPPEQILVPTLPR